ncbi:MAG TPA: flagellar motor protein MotD [Sedimenticola sp.]|nr:flagellar motor protein MotD [Sedimenticola sp.]
MRRKRRREEPEQHERWLVSYADFITLLFAFFVVMYSISSVNEGKYRVLSNTLVESFQDRAKSMDPIQVGEPVRTLVPPPPGLVEESPPGVLPGTAESPQEPERQAEEELPLAAVAARLEAAMAPFIDQDLVEVTQNEHGVEVEIKSKLLFQSGSARISHRALRVLRDIAAILRPLPNAINVEGHTDNVPIKTPAFPSNWELSASRAASVVHIFSRLGIEPQRLAAIGYAEHRPVSDNTTAAGRQKNRRVSLLIMADNRRRGSRNAMAPPPQGTP